MIMRLALPSVFASARIRRLTVVALVAALFLAVLPLHPAHPQTGGRILYVSPAGSDNNPGTLQAPFRTVSRGISALRAGDTLQLRGGTYTENVNVTVPAGTAGSRIRITRYPGEQPVIRGLFWLRRPQHVTIDGLHITWDTSNGPSQHMVKITDGVGWELRNNRIWGARSFAGLLVASGGASNEPSGWRVVNNCIHDTIRTNNTNQDHLMYVNAPGSTGGVIEGNVLFNALNGEAVKIGGPDATSPGTSHTVVRYNTMHNTSQNVLIAWRSGNNDVYRNILGRAVNVQVRGYQLAATGNVVRDNAVAPAPRFIHNDAGYQQVRDGGNLMPVDAQFDRTDACGGFTPRNPAVRGYGHTASSGGGSATPPEPVNDPDSDAIDRIAGDDRIQTALKVSRESWASGSASGAVLARADAFPDALAGAPLAAHAGGPVLLTPGNRLPPDVATELRRILPSGASVYLLGGWRALNGSVADAVAASGFTPRRISGRDRYETAEAIVDVIGSPRIVLIATGQDFADALAAGAAASSRGGAVVLTTPNQPHPAAERVLRKHDVPHYAVGGPAARAHPRARAITGSDRFATARAVADLFFDSPKAVGLARSDAFADALTGGVHAAARGGPMLLTPRSSLHPTAGRYVCSKKVGRAYAYGGKAALSPSVLHSTVDHIEGKAC